MRSPLIHILGALVMLLIASSAYGVWYRIISQKSQHVADVEQKIIDANKNVRRIALARTALAEIANDEAAVRSYFVSEAGVVAFIDGLEKIGSTEKAEVSVLSVSSAGSPSQPVLSLSLSIKGTFDAVMRTTGAIEYSPYDLWVTRLSVTHDEKNLWHADIGLSVGSAPVATTSPTH